MTGYTLLSKPRTNKRGGRVGMFGSSGLNIKLRDDLHMNCASCGFKSVFIEVKIQNKCYYSRTPVQRPPSTKTIPLIGPHFL